MALPMALKMDAQRMDLPQENAQKSLTAPRPRGRGRSRSGFRRSSLAGCIMWLPSRAEIGSASDIDDNCYNHPVVVLSPQPRRGKVSFLTLTPLNGKSLEDRHPHNLWARLVYLPIDPCEPHPDNGLLLRLQNPSNPLRQPCYVATDKQFRVASTALRPYDRPELDYRLNIQSYRILVDYIQFHDVETPSRSLLPAPGEVEPKPARFQRQSSDSDLESSQPLLHGGSADSPPREGNEVTLWTPTPYRTFAPQSGIEESPEIEEASCELDRPQQISATIHNNQLSRSAELSISLIEEGYQGSSLLQPPVPADSWPRTRSKSSRRERGVVIQFARERRVLKKSPSILTIVICWPCLLLLAFSLLFVELAVYVLG